MLRGLSRDRFAAPCSSRGESFGPSGVLARRPLYATLLISQEITEGTDFRRGLDERTPAATAPSDTLNDLGAPRGSRLLVEATGRQIPFGMTEGLAVYLNGTDLPDEVYRDCDSNYVHSELNRLLDREGRVLSWWEGPTETAFYLYGSSFLSMRSRLDGFLWTYPLCQRCRIEQIA